MCFSILACFNLKNKNKNKKNNTLNTKFILKCNKCNIVFYNEIDFNNHLKLSHGEKI